MGNQKNQPKQKYRAGAITGTIWENSFVGKDEAVIKKLTMNVSRIYKDKDGNWKETTSFNQNDIPKLLLVAQKSYEYMTLGKEVGEDDE